MKNDNTSTNVQDSTQYKKPELELIKNLIEQGHSLLTANSKKRPLQEWKKLQSTALDFETFKTKAYNKLKQGETVGLITGYNNLEVIDIDLKAFGDDEEAKKNWFDSYIGYCRALIEDFDDKIVVMQTKNAGYHFIYRTSEGDEPRGNTKLAKLQGHTQEVLETRGEGGYVVLYDDNITGQSYEDIQVISKADRELLWSASKYYNYEEPTIADKPLERISKALKTPEGAITPWDDYNAKTDVWDLISSEFTLVKTLANGDRIIIRNGATDSEKSGTIFADTNNLYLFTTATQYPNQQKMTAYEVFCIQNNLDPRKEGGIRLREMEYGTPLEKVKTNTKPRAKMTLEDAIAIAQGVLKPTEEEPEFPKFLFTEGVDEMLVVASDINGYPLDFLRGNLLATLSAIIGNGFQVKVKNGWTVKGNLFMMMVGGQGSMKSPSARFINGEVRKSNQGFKNTYTIERTKWDAEQTQLKAQATKSGNMYEPSSNKPKSNQFIMGSPTGEARRSRLASNQLGQIEMYDEVKTLFTSANQYRQGSDIEDLLSYWDGEGASAERNDETLSVDPISPFLSIVGSIQPNPLKDLKNKGTDNGLFERFLYVAPETDIKDEDDREMSEDMLEQYGKLMKGFVDMFKLRAYSYEQDTNALLPTILTLSPEASKIAMDYRNHLKSIERKYNNKYIAPIPKLNTYFAKLMNTIHVANQCLGGTRSAPDDMPTVIGVETVEIAKRLIDYFFFMATKVNNPSRALRPDSVEVDMYPLYKQFKEGGLSGKDIATALDIDITRVYNWNKKYDKENR
jgi:hypothetical protein